MTDEDGTLGGDGFLTAPVGARLRARVLSAPFKYRDIGELPRSYRAHQERWTVREDITLAEVTPVDTGEVDEDGEPVMRDELVRPSAEEVLARAAEVGPTLMIPRKPWAVVRAVDAATGETVLGVPCAVTAQGGDEGRARQMLLAASQEAYTCRQEVSKCVC